MFPVCDVIPSRRTPVTTIGLILANVVVFGYGLRLDGIDPDGPAHTLAAAAGTVDWTAAITGAFIHGGWVHLGGNMLCLWIFGDNVEDAMGHAPFLLFYLAAAALGAVAHATVSAASMSPLLGASAPVAAVMAAYFVLYPRSRILVLVFLLPYVDVIEIPAIFLLGFWLLLQVGTSAALPGAEVASLAPFAALAAGFAAGAVTGLALRRRERWN